MRSFLILFALVFVAQVNSQFWKYPQEFFNSFSWLRQGKTSTENRSSIATTTLPVTIQVNSTKLEEYTESTTSTGTSSEEESSSTSLPDTTTQEVTGTTEEPRDNHRVHDFYLSKREKPEVKIASNISQVSTNEFELSLKILLRE